MTQQLLRTKQSIILFILFGFSVQLIAQKMDDKSKILIEALKIKNGGWERLAAKQDVQFTYIYDDKAKGIDVSKERHIFNGEHSWATYEKHEVNVLPGKTGIVKQSLVDGKPAITLNEKTISDEAAIGGTTFLRRVNFFWFTMMYKLDNPGTIFTYLGNEKVNGVNYDKVNLTYDSAITGKAQNDEFILYFNPKTHFIDLFYFSLPAFGVNQPVLRMELTYTEIDGIYLTTERKGYFPNEKGEYSLGGVYTTKNVKFNNGFNEENFKL